MNERERAILRGKPITPQTEDEAAMKYAIDNGGGGGGLVVVEAACEEGFAPPVGQESVMYELTDATMSYAEIAAAMENGSDVVFRVHDYMIDRKPYYDLVITQVEQDGTIVFTGQSPGCNLYVFVYPYRENIYISLSRNIAEMQFFQFTVNKSGDQYTVTPGVNVTWAEVERVIRTYNAAVARFVIPGSSPQRVIRAAFNEVITDNAVTARTLVDNNGSVEYWELVYYKSSGTAEMHVKTLTTT